MSLIYCSDEVLTAINELAQLRIASDDKDPNSQDGRKAMGNSVLAIRIDLLGKTSLSYKDFRYTNVLK